MHDPLGPCARVGDGWSVKLGGGGGSAWRRNAGGSVPATGVSYGVRDMAQKEQRNVQGLTEDQDRAEMACRASASSSGGGARRTSQRRLLQVFSRRLDPTGGFNVELRTQGRDQRGRRTTGSVRLRWRPTLPVARSRGNSRRRRGSGSRQSARECPWARGEVAARLGGRLRCGGATWRRQRRVLFAAELCWRDGLGFGAAL